jgi:hypothetical protein
MSRKKKKKKNPQEQFDWKASKQMPAKNVSNSEHFCKTIASRYASSPCPQIFPSIHGWLHCKGSSNKTCGSLDQGGW